MALQTGLPDVSGVGTSRLWWMIVLALFCLPLFIGLGRGDLFGDEGIYSFGVDRILESGDWLAPKVSPFEDRPFLEKPPLKFWIVAAPIRLGLLPHNEFGLRFWDALFGGISFLYVFALGCRLAGPVCGAVAVLTLFAHGPLIFDHGLRSNNMEAALLLCYCGGVYHFIAWTTAERRSRARLHAVAVGLYFVLGFMTKFVAAVFLPVVLASSALLVRDYRAKLRRDWLLWASVKLVVVSLCAPWFVYAHHRFGRDLWQTMFTAHIVERFTASLDPEHLHPWYYYAVSIYRALSNSDAVVIVALGLGFLAVLAVRRPARPEHLVILSWLVLPIVLISFGTSKLYHYAYPYVPPLALAAGYAASLLLMLAPAPTERILQRWNSEDASRWSLTRAIRRRPAVRVVLLAIAAIGILFSITSVLYGVVRLDLPGGLMFRSRGLFRPLAVALVCGVLASSRLATARVVVPLVVASLLPLPGYRETLARLTEGAPVMSAATDCLQRVEREVAGSALPGIYLDIPDAAFGQHVMNYYFRRLRPWTRAETPSPARLGPYLRDVTLQRPILVWQPTYREFRESAGPDSLGPAVSTGSPASLATVRLPDDILLLLPGPYAVCDTDGAD